VVSDIPRRAITVSKVDIVISVVCGFRSVEIAAGTECMCSHEHVPRNVNDYQAVLFDWDGTLVDSHPLHFAALSQACKSEGLTLSYDFYQSRIGASGAEVISEAAHAAGIAVPVENIVNSCLDNILKRISTLRTYSPVVHAAEALRATTPLAVVSGGARKIVQAGLKFTELGSLFEYVITGEDASRGKPDPELFLIAARHLRVRPSACLVYEDSPEGFRAAIDAGMRVVDVRHFRRGGDAQ
jgi:HAD superfamily hydrolase (TIGR01509 family)